MSFLLRGLALPSNNGIIKQKEEGRFHGFGMKSMRRTVEHYGGSLVAEQEDKWFSLKILIPIQM